MNTIIGFCGRCQSGKTELAKICEEFGFEKISFATPLKQLVANLLNCTITEVNNLKTAKFNFVCDEEKCKFVSEECNIPIEIINEHLLNKTFENTRQMLQFIGTNVIRNYNNDWHVNKTKELIKQNKNYVIDDVRFPNEANMIKELNGDLWFIIRPKIDNVSNHESETALKWQDFENLIINNKSLEYIQLMWRMFLDNGYKSQLKKKHEMYFNIINDTQLQNKIKQDNENIVLCEALFLNKEIFTYKKPILNEYKTIKLHKGEIFAETQKLEHVKITNPLEIEDLKILL